MSPPVPFADRLERAIREKRSCLVVGLDPVVERLPRELLARVPAGRLTPGWTAHAGAAVGRFLEGIVDSVAPHAVAVKPNVAFFERIGAVGWDVLRRACELSKRRGLLVIADGKRGDVGHTAEAYAEAFLGDTPDTLGPHTDAVTLNPYLGRDSVLPFLEQARKHGKGVFVLVRTSNPSAGEIQDLPAGREAIPLYRRVAQEVAAWGRGLEGACGLSSVGAVVAATAPAQAEDVRRVLPAAFFLVPGYGAQGGAAEAVASCFLPGGRGAVVSASRSVLYAFAREEGVSWREAAARAAQRARGALEEVRGRSRSS